MKSIWWASFLVVMLVGARAEAMPCRDWDISGCCQRGGWVEMPDGTMFNCGEVVVIDGRAPNPCNADIASCLPPNRRPQVPVPEGGRGGPAGPAGGGGGGHTAGCTTERLQWISDADECHRCGGYMDFKNAEVCTTAFIEGGIASAGILGGVLIGVTTATGVGAVILGGIAGTVAIITGTYGCENTCHPTDRSDPIGPHLWANTNARQRDDDGGEPDPLPRPTPTPRSPEPTIRAVYLEGMELPTYQGVGNPFVTYGFSQSEIDQLSDLVLTDSMFVATMLQGAFDAGIISESSYQQQRIAAMSRIAQEAENIALKRLKTPNRVRQFLAELVWYNGVVKSWGHYGTLN